jgi:hypothetical protein
MAEDYNDKISDKIILYGDHFHGRGQLHGLWPRR